MKKFMNMITNRTGKISVLLILALGLMLQCKSGLDEDKITEELYQNSISIAKESERKILIVFGAEWCPDCQSLKDRFFNNPEIAGILQEKYLTVYVDVGRFDRNLLFSEKFDSPQKKGIPALVILDPNEPEKILASTKGGEFSSARKMSDESIAKYLLQY
jgi:thiol-disulfide isomerase/thioredoxin